MKVIAISDASDAELRKYAEEKYNLNFGPQGNGAKRATILAKLQAVHTGETIEVDEGDAPVASVQESRDEAAKRAREWGEQMLIINIPMGEGKNGQQPVFVAAEGRSILVPRGQWCEVKQIFVQSLREAVEDQYSQVKGEDGLTKISDKPAKVTRFPFQQWHDPNNLPPDLLRWSTVSKKAA